MLNSFLQASRRPIIVLAHAYDIDVVGLRCVKIALQFVRLKSSANLNRLVRRRTNDGTAALVILFGGFICGRPGRGIRGHHSSPLIQLCVGAWIIATVLLTLTCCCCPVMSATAETTTRRGKIEHLTFFRAFCSDITKQMHSDFSEFYVHE